MARETKRCLALFGSPHKEGPTARLLEAFLSPLGEDWQVERVDLFRLLPQPCTGCGFCKGQERCAFPDLDALDRAFRQCDLLVVASPVYNISFPAPLKAWLDRTQRYFEARFSLGMRPPIAKHRQAALLLTMGSEDSFGPQVCAHQLEQAFSVMNTTLEGVALWQGTDRGDQGWEAARRQAAALGRRLSGQEGPGVA